MKTKKLNSILAGTLMIAGAGTLAAVTAGTENQLQNLAGTPDFVIPGEVKTLPPSHNENPWGLVYGNAISENLPNQVNIIPVRYKLHDIDVAANVYVPANWSRNNADSGVPAKFPAVVVAHPNGGVKEQVAGLFAERLARAGFIAIAADTRFQGASGGLPRHLDTPANRIEDIRGMVDYILTFPRVDGTAIGAFGICGGGGYTLGAAQSDKRIRAVATLSMFNSGRVRRNGFRDSQISTIRERLLAAAEARGNADLCVGDMSQLTDEQAAALPFALYRDGFRYYLRTHAHPNSTFLYTQASLLELMTWDATDHMALLDQPLLMICGDNADTRYMTDEAFAKATGTPDKQLFLVPNAQHIETYHIPEFVELETAKLVEFFRSKLCQSAHNADVDDDSTVPANAQNPEINVPPRALNSGNNVPADFVPARAEIFNSSKFIGDVFRVPLIRQNGATELTSVNIITFAPGARGGWHVHGKMLIVALDGVGYYQEKGKSARILRRGDVVEIPAGTLHWHGATKNSHFSQLVLWDENYSEPVPAPVHLTDKEYNNLPQE